MFYRIFTISFLVASTSVFFGCVPSRQVQRDELVQKEVFVVRVPPFYDPSITPGQNHWLWREFLFPQEVADTRNKNEPIPDLGVPNDDSVITVKLSEDGKLFINSMNYGDISNTESVMDKLKEVFEARAKNGVFEPGSQKVVKAVGIRLPIAAKYGDLVTVVRVVKESGAEPIVLLINGHLPEMRLSPPSR